MTAWRGIWCHDICGNKQQSAEYRVQSTDDIVYKVTLLKLNMKTI